MRFGDKKQAKQNLDLKLLDQKEVLLSIVIIATYYKYKETV